MAAIRGFGLPVAELLIRVETLDRALAHYRRIEAMRADLPFDIDGVVYKVDRLDWQERLGFVAQGAALGDRAQIPGASRRKPP